MNIQETYGCRDVAPAVENGWKCVKCGAIWLSDSWGVCQDCGWIREKAHPPCPSCEKLSKLLNHHRKAIGQVVKSYNAAYMDCEKLRAENAELNTQRNNAEIQLVAIIQAVSGFTKTKPKMTIGEFEKYLSKICKFAREAEKEEFERKIRLNQPKGEGDIK